MCTTLTLSFRGAAPLVAPLVLATRRHYARSVVSLLVLLEDLDWCLTVCVSSCASITRVTVIWLIPLSGVRSCTGVWNEVSTSLADCCEEWDSGASMRP